jgi:hypothetical protein
MGTMKDLSSIIAAPGWHKYKYQPLVLFCAMTGAHQPTWRLVPWDTTVTSRVTALLCLANVGNAMCPVHGPFHRIAGKAPDGRYPAASLTPRKGALSLASPYSKFCYRTAASCSTKSQGHCRVQPQEYVWNRKTRRSCTVLLVGGRATLFAVSLENSSPPIWTVADHRKRFYSHAPWFAVSAWLQCLMWCDRTATTTTMPGI